MLLAGCGYGYWRPLVTALTRDPRCPFNPEEDRDTWERENQRAHVQCGWPAQLTALKYPQLRQLAFPEHFAPDWLRALAFLHVLKYARRAPDARLAIIYGGTRHLVDTRMSTGFAGLTAASLGMVTRGLRVPRLGDSDPARRWYDALHSALMAMSFGDLCQLRPLSSLPPDVVAGPWSTLVPAPAPDPDAWVQHGAELSGVKLARPHRGDPMRGVVVDVRDTDELILGYHWNLDDARTEMRRIEREVLWDTLPDTYAVTEMPFDVLQRYFPNISESTLPPELIDAYRAVMDTTVFASLLRHEIPSLTREFPIVVFLPWSASVEEATNTGKTSAAVTWGRALCPSLPLQASSSPDSNSAPDTRTIVTQLLEHGTIVLDEFVAPRQDHPLAKRHLQTLATGGTYNGGLARQNDGRVSLRHSLVLSAKAITRWGPDMLTRTYPVWLGPLTDDQRLGRGTHTFDEISSGRAAMEIRFSAWSILSSQPVLDIINQTRAGATRRARFSTHFALAQLCLEMRSGIEAGSNESIYAIDRAMEWAQCRINTHADQAVHSGVEADMEQTRAPRMHLATFMRAFSPQGLSAAMQLEDGMTVEKFIRDAPASAGAYDLSPDATVRWWHHTTGARFDSLRSLIGAAERMLTEHAARTGADYVTVPVEYQDLLHIWRRRGTTWHFVPQLAGVDPVPK